MKDNKEKMTGMFTGWKDVASFTAGQDLKGKGFMTTTIVVAILIAAAMILLNIVPAIISEDTNIEDSNGVIDSNEIDGDVVEIEEDGKITFSKLTGVYIINDTDYSNEGMKEAFGVIEARCKNIDKLDYVEDMSKINLDSKTKLVVKVTIGNYGNLELQVLIPQGSDVTESEADAFGAILTNSIAESRYMLVELTEEESAYVGIPSYSSTVATDEEGESLGVMITKILVPMVVCFLMYMVILMYGQSISKAIVADKSSKLMEMLLTSVKPYAIISGKIIGTVGIALAQIFSWIIAGVIGFIVGDFLATQMNPDYVNQIKSIIDLMNTSSNGSAFTVGAIILSILALVVGFFMYSVLAGLSGAMISKIEDMSAASSIFQIPVVIAFLLAYFGSVGSIHSTDTLFVNILRFVPITSPFLLPADILIGNMSILSGLVSLGILVLTCLLLILVTGKIYKNKIFNQK